jgi:hypothetical protein
MCSGGCGAIVRTVATGVAAGPERELIGSRTARLLEWPLAGSLAVAIFLFGCGSSSVLRLSQYAHATRWGGLALFATVALIETVVRARLLRPPRGAAVVFGALLVLAIGSAAWSLAPRLTAERALTLAMLFVAVVAVCRVGAGRLEVIGRLAGAVAVAALAFAVAGLLLAATQPALGFLFGATLRYRGLGENPDTAPLLEGLAIPLVVWLVLRAEGRRRVLWIIGLVVLVQSVALSGSRGSIVSTGVAVLVQMALYPRSVRYRLKAIAIVLLVLFYVNFSGSYAQRFIHIRSTVHSLTVVIPAYAPSLTAPCPTTVVATAKPPRVTSLGQISVSGPKSVLGLLGLFTPRNGSFFYGSGRVQAWQAAIQVGDGRPVLGHGFGTEEIAFRAASCRLIQVFQGGLVENSYLGLYLQLGAAGCAMLLVGLGLLLRSGIRALKSARGPERALTATLLGVLIAGLGQAIFQTYLFSVGDIATLAFWTCCALLLALGAEAHAAKRQIGDYMDLRVARESA